MLHQRIHPALTKALIKSLMDKQDFIQFCKFLGFELDVIQTGIQSNSRKCYGLWSRL